MVDDYAGYKALFAAARAHPSTQLLLEPCIELACRVDRDVSIPAPHRPGRAGLPHPVPHVMH
jgi:hypothetical protein